MSDPKQLGVRACVILQSFACALAPAQDAWEFFRPTFSIKDAQEKIKARQDIVAGALKDRFTKLSALLVRTSIRCAHTTLHFSTRCTRLATLLYLRASCTRAGIIRACVCAHADCACLSARVCVCVCVCVCICRRPTADSTLWATS